MNKEIIIENLNKLFPDPKCELNYEKDYELLIATMLSAQSTDKRVNEVTKILFKKYDIFSLQNAEIKDIESIIKPVGTYHKKAIFIQEIAKELVNKYNGIVPNNRVFLESLPGVGRKTTNVVLANIYNIPSFAVDTHVTRISKVFGIAKKDDNVLEIEKKLNKYFEKEMWNRLNNQMILFGRYICTAKRPRCSNCLFKDVCNKRELI